MESRENVKFTAFFNDCIVVLYGCENACYGRFFILRCF